MSNKHNQRLAVDGEWAKHRDKRQSRYSNKINRQAVKKDIRNSF